MSRWDTQQQVLLADSFSLHLAAGPTALEVEIGMVVTGGDLFVRAQRGTTSAWYVAAITHRTGHVRLGTQTFNVTFSAADPARMPQIDAAFRAKYGALAGFAESPDAQMGTLRIEPAGSTA